MWEDRKKQELKEAAITVPRCKNPIKRLRPRPLLQLPVVIPCFLRGFNRENLQSGTSCFHISKKYFSLPPCIVRIVIEHYPFINIFDGVLPYCLVEAGVAKKSISRSRTC